MNKKILIFGVLVPFFVLLLIQSYLYISISSKNEHINDTIPYMREHCRYSVAVAMAANRLYASKDLSQEELDRIKHQRDSVFNGYLFRLKMDPNRSFSGSQGVRIYQRNHHKLLVCRYDNESLYSSYGYVSYNTEGGKFDLQDSCRAFYVNENYLISCEGSFKENGEPLLNVIAYNSYYDSRDNTFYVYDVKSNSCVFSQGKDYVSYIENGYSGDGGGDDEESEDDGEEEDSGEDQYDDPGNGDPEYTEVRNSSTFALDTTQFENGYPIIVEQRRRVELHGDDSIETNSTHYYQFDDLYYREVDSETGKYLGDD